MRKGCQLLLRDQTGLYGTHLICTEALMEETLRMLTDRSLYSFSESMKCGYLPLQGGIRVAIGGRAITDGIHILSVKDISFLSVRIPHAIRGCAAPVYEKMKSTGLSKGVLLFSPPGVGKTTVLRELARTLSCGKPPKIVALIDERGELSFSLDECPGLCPYLYYPKKEAIAIAVRTACPDYLVLDEIGADEGEILLSCAPAGVPVLASAHGRSVEELRQKPEIAKLVDSGIFSLYVLIERKGTTMSFRYFDKHGEEQ